MWCKLEDLCSIKGGKRIPKGKGFSNQCTEHIYLRVTNMKNRTISLDDLKYIEEDVFQEIKNYTISSNDLYLTIAGTIGDVGEIPQEVSGMSLTENAAKLTDIGCNRLYLMYALLSTNSQEHFSSKFHQVAQPKLSIETASSTLLPLPPLAEQLRIVGEIEKWYKLIDNLESNATELQTVIAQTKSKVLDLAIHGKLVLQDPADEPAIELLKRINPDFTPCDNGHYPFDVPSGWIFAQGKCIFTSMRSTKPKGDTFLYADIDSIDNHLNIVRPKSISVSLAPSRASRHTENGDVLFSMVRPYLRNIAMIECDECIASTGFYVCHSNGSILPKYCLNMMLSDYVVSGLNHFMKGDNSPSINKSNLDDFPFPISPLAEQQRIVAKIEETFSILDGIQNSLEA
ncbi:restriction endonuclease subunit S [Parabacteroides faecis]|uniref:Type I restriction enzyme S subunit n=1 Tax=Parabacteroides faecis TaxID=1217282 RepID=A0ABR6KKH6_9BACT|nr:restriction endonuclease subunit S [Parabacteroides faecis]MBB4622007.1 type I restriction enzyme S subunit [Parabacteroides faecis]GGJ82099.1 type I restriction endonuclease EcoAI [Parabacteroides faecis]